MFNSSRLWRNRDFLYLWGGQTISTFGTQVTALALPLTAIILLNATSFQMGLLAAMSRGASGNAGILVRTAMLSSFGMACTVC